MRRYDLRRPLTRVSCGYRRWLQYCLKDGVSSAAHDKKEGTSPKSSRPKALVLAVVAIGLKLTSPYAEPPHNVILSCRTAYAEVTSAAVSAGGPPVLISTSPDFLAAPGARPATR